MWILPEELEAVNLDHVRRVFVKESAIFLEFASNDSHVVACKNEEEAQFAFRELFEALGQTLDKGIEQPRKIKLVFVSPDGTTRTAEEMAEKLKART